MKYLVTDAAGFIGIHTYFKIIKKYKNFKFYKADIANPILVKKIFQKILPSHVIHLTAQLA